MGRDKIGLVLGARNRIGETKEQSSYLISRKQTHKVSQMKKSVLTGGCICMGAYAALGGQ